MAMKYGEMHPHHIAAMVIEDMDIRKRDYSKVSNDDLEQRRFVSNNRDFPTFDDLEERLKLWYDVSRIRRWADDGRVFSRNEGDQSSWWCGVNPLAQFHARSSVLEVVGESEWTACGKASFPIHLFIAGRDSACSDVSVEAMCEIVPRTKVQYFFDAEHSIHRTGFDQFIAKIDEVVYPDAMQFLTSCEEFRFKES